MAKIKGSKEAIKERMSNYYNLDFKLDDIRENYTFDSSAKYTMPAALNAFFESDSFIDAIRNAISLGGDSDSLAAITGSIAASYYGVDKKYKMIVEAYLYDDYLLETYSDIKESLNKLKKG